MSIKHLIKYVIYYFAYLLHYNHDSKIIYYHDVGRKYTDMGTDLDQIKKHIEIVRKSRYTIVDEISQPRGQIMICFDDGWAGIYDAIDFFINEKIYPTIFIAVELIGRNGYLTLEQILEMQSLGFHFEGHTWSHNDLTTFDDEGLWHEIKDSKEELSKLLGKEVTSLCFPQGRFSEKVYQESLRAGYSKLYSSISGGYYDLLESKKLICRKLVQSASTKEFKYIINSSSPYLKRRAIKLHYKN